MSALVKEEKYRTGGLLFDDFYRVNILFLNKTLLAKYNKEQLKILRNSLFARYGRKFKEKKLSKIFYFMPWYKATDISVSEIFDVRMSEREKNNILLMIKIEKSL
jgi:hypothetical protein